MQNSTYSYELCYYPFAGYLDRCVRSFNNEKSFDFVCSSIANQGRMFMSSQVIKNKFIKRISKMLLQIGFVE